MKPSTVVLLALALSLPLTGCGRKGTPDPPPGAFYPKLYPYVATPKRPPTPDDDLDAVEPPAETEDGTKPKVVPGDRALFDGLKHPDPKP